MNPELIGYAAGSIVAISLAPQVIKAWKTRSTKDISIVWNLIYLTGLLLWVVYGFTIQSYPIIITLSVEAFLAFLLLLLKLRHG